METKEQRRPLFFRPLKSVDCGETRGKREFTDTSAGEKWTKSTLKMDNLVSSCVFLLRGEPK